jgi:PAS domain S-box-containing protein
MSIGRIFSWEMNPATREIEWSNNMEDVIGFPLFDNIDKTFELFHPDDGKYAIDAINKAIETRVEYESEYRLVNPQNGEVFWFHSQGAITTNNADGNPRFIGITQNITERKQAEEALCQSEEQAHLLIESATDFAIFRVALDNRIASWNTGAEKVFGYAESEIIGQPCDILFTPEDREKGVPAKEMEIALREGSAEDERWHLCKDGSRFFASGKMMGSRKATKALSKSPATKPKDSKSKKHIVTRKYCKKSFTDRKPSANELPATFTMNSVSN